MSLTAREVVSMLRYEFPHLTAQKVRCLAEQGMLGSAEALHGSFAVTDVVLVVRILRMQRDDHLPLRTIAERLNDPPRGTHQ